MTPAPLTPADVALVRALASLARYAPERMRALHLAAPAEALAERVERAAEQAVRDG